MKLIYPAIFKPFTDQSGGYVVEFPDLPGCVTEGKNLEQAIEMGIDAASGWILGELEDGEQIPRASNYSEITAEDDPNVTDRKFPGNPTKSYRSKHPLKIVAEVIKWEGHSPEILNNMLENLRKLSEQGIKAID